MKNEYRNSTIDQQICNDFRLSESISGNRSCVRMKQNHNPACGKINAQENQLEIYNFSEQSQSDLRIRYAFYNRGFEVVTSTKQRKNSSSHHEFRWKKMADIDEYESIDNEESSDDCLDSSLNKNLYTGSSGRDITLLPKLKIRLSDASRAENKHSSDESKSSEDSFNTDESNEAISIVIQKEFIDNLNTIENGIPSSSNETQFVPRKTDRDHFSDVDSEETITTCKKCGHKLKIQKTFSNAFV